MYKIPKNYLYMSAWNAHINLRQTGKDVPEPGSHYGPAVREHFLIHIVTSGKGVYSVRGKDYSVHAGEAFIIYPNEITVYTADQEDPWRYYFFAFSGDMAELLVPGMGFSLKRLVIPFVGKEVTTIIDETIDAIYNVSQTDNILSLIQLFRIVSCFTRNNPQADSEDMKANHYVQEAIAYIEGHYAENITVADLAAALAIDRSYLYRIFKNDTGISPKEYLNTYRIDVARSLLAETDLSVSQIALSVGFTTFSSFYRLFVRQFSCSPREYQLACKSQIQVDSPIVVATAKRKEKENNKQQSSGNK